jgi:hypothetical protein
VTVSGSGFVPNELIDLTLHTETVLLKTVQADSSGAFSTTVTLPTGVTGSHTIVATGRSGESNVPTANMNIGCAAAQPVAEGLSNTGVAIMSIGGVGVLLLVAGGLVLFSSRRRKVNA